MLQTVPFQPPSPGPAGGRPAKQPAQRAYGLPSSNLPNDAVLALQAQLHELELTAALELVHSTRQSGVLQVYAQLSGGSLPLELAFAAGEIFGCSVMDWRGADALFAYPQAAKAGEMRFWQFDTSAARQALPQAAQLQQPFLGLMGDWARLSDEWPRVLQHMPSPSQRFYGSIEPFDCRGGASVRRVVAMTREPLFEVASQVAALAEAGILQPVQSSFEWDLLVLPPPATARERPGQNPTLRLLDGRQPLTHLIRRGLDEVRIRRELLPHIGPGWKFAGAGRVLRDWLWEIEAEEKQLQQSAS